MSPRGLLARAGAAALTAILALTAWAIWPARLPAAAAWNCRGIFVAPGPEDFAYHGGALYVSAADRRDRAAAGGELYRLTWPNGRPRRLTRIGEPKGFVLRPHGIDLRRVPGGLELYAVSHRAGLLEPGSVVVRYRVVGDALKHLETFADPALASPNDVAVLDDGCFFASNDRSRRAAWSEAVLGLAGGGVVKYCPGAGFRPFVTGTRGANGLAAFDGRLYAAETGADRAGLYPQLGGPRAAGRSLASIPLSGPDNLLRAGDTLYAAGHPDRPAFALHALFPGWKSPSVVYAIDSATDTARPIFADDGGRISAASAALVIGGELVLGQVFGDYLLACLPARSKLGEAPSGGSP